MPAQALNFVFLPPSMRVVWVAACSFLWVNILCRFKRQSPEETEVKTVGVDPGIVGLAVEAPLLA